MFWILESSIYSRGIAGVGQHLLCVGNHQGEILVFNIPQNGTNIFLKETIPGHQHGITGLVSNEDVLVSSDTTGTILIWNIHTMLQTNVIEPVDDSGITSLSMWKNCITAGYANGMIRFFDAINGE
jgi:WD40 repeat protein